MFVSTVDQVVEQLSQRIAEGGLKTLIGNNAYRRFLRIEGTKAEIDQKAILFQKTVGIAGFMLRVPANLSLAKPCSVSGVPHDTIEQEIH